MCPCTIFIFLGKKIYSTIKGFTLITG